MKKYLQILVVVALVLTVIGIAGGNSAWAGSWFSSAQPKPASDISPADLNASQPFSIVITGSGSYLVGGVCKIDVEYKGTGLKDNADAEVPVSESSKVSFSGEGELFYPGCHIVHFKADKKVDQASADDGSWKVCFAQRPDIKMVIYYYMDNPTGGSRVWQALDTTSENGFACASAMFTGVYMPAGKVENQPGGISDSKVNPPPAPAPAPTPRPGTVRPAPPPPPDPNSIAKSGTYGVGGICTLIIQYKVDRLSDTLFVEVPVRDDKTVGFPTDKGDILFLPGCHVMHYERSILQKQMGAEKGTWKICFAAPPNLTMTIYFYRSDVHKDVDEAVTPPWQPLTTTTENGMACAAADFTGVYVPAGQ